MSAFESYTTQQVTDARGRVSGGHGTRTRNRLPGT